MVAVAQPAMAVSAGLDPFRARQAPSVAARFREERDRHQRQAALMWLGTLMANFSYHELKLLADLGYLSRQDADLLRQAGR